MIIEGRRLVRSTTLCGWVLAFSPCIAFAADWDFTQGINIGAEYTDNVELVETGKKSEVTALVTPHFSLRGKGAHANVDVTAAFEINGRGGTTDSVNPRLQADANAELYERVFFIDLNATATQNAIDPLSPSGIDNLSDNGNSTTTYNYQISPYLKGRFQGIADAELRYTYNGINHSESGISDTSSESVSLSIDSGEKFNKLSLGLDANHRTTDNESGEISQFDSVDFRLGYQINRKWKITGSLGTESNDFASTQSNTDGERWDIGAIWTPNARTTLDFGIGDRFFGNTKRFTFTHKSRQSVISASYSHELTDATTLLSEQRVFALVDDFGQPIIDPVSGDPQLVIRDLVTLNDSTFVDERFNLSYSLKGRRTTLTVDGDISDQKYQDSSRKVSNVGLGAQLTRTLSGKLSGDLGLSWDERDESGISNRETETWVFNAGLNQQLGKKTSLRFSYSYVDFESNQAGQGYEENKLSLTLMHSL